MTVIIALALAAVVVVFGVQNTQSATFQFMGYETGPTPVIFAVPGGAVVGALIAWLAMAPGRVRGMLHERGLERQVAKEQERTAKEQQRLAKALEDSH